MDKVFVGLLLLACCAHISLGGPCGLGTYVGNPNGNDPVAMAQFESQFDNFTKYMGVAPTYMNAFVDFTHNWTTWVDNAGWGAWSWSLSNRSRSLIPVIGLPMMPASWSDNYEEIMLNEIVAGTYDDVFTGIILAWAKNNYTTLHVRIGWEADGNWYSWSFNGKNSTGGWIYPLWVEAWRHIANVVHNVPGVKVITAWNPSTSGWSPFNMTLTYPGDDVVDVIGLDLYSMIWPDSLYDWEMNNGTIDANITIFAKSAINREHVWNYPAATQWDMESMGGWGMKSHLALAESHNKPIAFCESGTGTSPSNPGQGISDDGDFPIYLANAVSESGLDCLYIDIWDVDVGDGTWEFSDGSKPAAAAAWKQAFGQ